MRANDLNVEINLITIDHHPNRITNEDEPVSDPTFIITVFSGLWICHS